jgi:hypothetical protein
MGRPILGLGIAGLLVAGGLLAGLDGLRARSALDAARRENSALRARQEALREQAFDLARHLSEDFERGDRALRMAGPSSGAWSGRGPRLPARDASDPALLAWLSRQIEVLEAVGTERAPGRVGTGGTQADVPEAVRWAAAPARFAALLPPMDVGPARRKPPAPPQR